MGTTPSTTVGSSKTYTALTDIPKVIIGKCSTLLANHMQCWRAGDFQVTIPAEPVTAADGTITQDVTTYQLCRRHALLEQENDAILVQAQHRIENDKAQLEQAEQAIPQANTTSTTSAAATTPAPTSVKPLAK